MTIQYSLYTDICKLVDYLLKNDICFKVGQKRDRLKILQERLLEQEYTIAEQREHEVEESVKGDGFQYFKDKLKEFK